jgi:hypothetical protein
MRDSTPTHTSPPAEPTVGLRIAVMERRFRFAALLSRFSGQSIERAWRVFRPLPAPDGEWGVPAMAAGQQDESGPGDRG